MIIADKPYVSRFLQQTALDMGIPVFNSSKDKSLITLEDLSILDETEFLELALQESPLLLYSNSENSLQWIYQNLQATAYPKTIEVFKNKALFRKMTKDIYSQFYFWEVSYEQLTGIDPGKIPKPFIIKPSVGFFSMGVYKVNADEEWEAVIDLIQEEMAQANGLYPSEVLSSSKFIIEEYIEGTEYAIDAYYNSSGKPVILNIFEHPFSSAGDVSDRVYLTSHSIIKKNLIPFRNALASLGSTAGVANLPVHAEVRVDNKGNVIPIEVNPMRFAGWCTTDLAYYAYGINVYEYYFKQREPDWDEILRHEDNNQYCLAVADLPKGTDLRGVKGFDYEGYLANFSDVLENRKMNYREYPVFAFSFLRTKPHSAEVDRLLKMDMSRYIY